jgi:hypothetical protein
VGFLDRLFGKKEKGKKQEPASMPPRPSAKPDFPLGENIVSDADIRIFSDLARFYPLPAGLEYRQLDQGQPAIVRQADGRQFSFLIEAGLLTFDEPYAKPDGKIAYKTTEVFKRT